MAAAFTRFVRRIRAMPVHEPDIKKVYDDLDFQR